MDEARCAEGSSNAAAWLALTLLMAIVAVFQLVRPFTFAQGSWDPLFTLGGGFALVGFLFSRFRANHEFTQIFLTFIQMLLFSTFGAILSYQLARFDAPLADHYLWAFDRALGFDWMRWMQWLENQPRTAAALRFAYGSLIPQIALLVILLGHDRQLTTLRTVILAGILTGVTCITISGAVPALGYPPLMGVRQGQFLNVDPIGGIVQLHDLVALRHGQLSAIHLPSLKGIVTFPSYHAGLSLVTAYGFWNCRQGWIKWPGLVLAATTIAATPIIGGHYLADVVAGLAIAAACIVASRQAIRWQPALTFFTALPSRRSRAAFAR